jgi:hypothetical protein
MTEDKYIAIKIADFNYWLWFESNKTTEGNGIFTGKDGWGKRGAYTNITINSSQIIGRIETDTLQYS